MIALALSLFFLGTLARALDRRGPLWLPAVLLAFTVTSHLVVAIFAVFAGVVIWLIYHPVRNLTRVVAIGAVGMLLTAFWLLPLAVNLGNTTDMRYEPIGNYLDWMFLSENWFLYPLALFAIVAGIYYRRRATLVVASITVATGSCVLQLGRAARRARARRRRGTCACSRSGTSCCSCSAASAWRRWRGSPRSGATWVIRGSERARRSMLPSPRTTNRRRPATPDRPRTPAPAPRGMSRHAIRVVAIAVLAVVATTVTLVRVQQTRDFLPVLGAVQLHRLRERHRRPTSPRSRGPSTARSSTPPTRSRRGGWRGRAATRSVPTAHRSR